MAATKVTARQFDTEGNGTVIDDVTMVICVGDDWTHYSGVYPDSGGELGRVIEIGDGSGVKLCFRDGDALRRFGRMLAEIEG